MHQIINILVIMKKFTFILITLLTTIFFTYSCDNSNALKEEFDISQGIWIYTDRHVEISGTDLALKINPYLKEDADTVRLEQTFNNSTKESRLIAYSLKNEMERRNYQYRYSIVKDSLFLINLIKNDTLYEGVFNATKVNGKAKLEIQFKATKKQLHTLLMEIKSDPNILTSYPNDISGTYYIIAKQ